MESLNNFNGEKNQSCPIVKGQIFYLIQNCSLQNVQKLDFLSVFTFGYLYHKTFYQTAFVHDCITHLITF